MRGYFRAAAIDYDGTLTDGERPDPEVLDVLARARESTGMRLVLVTGRIVSELRTEFPDFADHFDGVVAENGAVLLADGVARALTAPVPVALDEALLRRGIPFRRGQVLLACDGEHDVAVLEDLRRLGLDAQIVRNRSHLMVLPAGITKCTGVAEALAELGVSRHNAIAVGDAENDQSLLDACEIGVAVSNAVPSLKERADVVLTQAGGEGVASLFSGPLVRDELRIEPRRWQVELGRSRDGDVVALPGSRANVLITGGSGSGKSYAGGLFAERLIGLGYSVCIFDPEGDHAPLGRLRNVVLVGGREALPEPAQLARLVQRGLGSVVVDLSFAPAERASYVAEALAALEKLRTDAGVPHWIVIDEAHLPPGVAVIDTGGLAASRKGYCLITYRPAELCAGDGGSIDYVLALPGERGIDPAIRDAIAQLATMPPAELEPEVTGVGLGHAVLLRPGGGKPRAFAFGPRWVAHVRHWHKYASAQLPPAQRFYFRSASGATGVAAGNLAEFHHELRRCSADVLRHHAAGLEFSRWLQDVIQDSTLAASVRSFESRLARASASDVEVMRNGMLQEVETRYLT